MKKFDVSPSKVLLILLGVLVAIIISFSSTAIGSNGSFVSLEPQSIAKNENTQNRISYLETPKKIGAFLLRLVK